MRTLLVVVVSLVLLAVPSMAHEEGVEYLRKHGDRAICLLLFTLGDGDEDVDIPSRVFPEDLDPVRPLVERLTRGGIQVRYRSDPCEGGTLLVRVSRRIDLGERDGHFFFASLVYIGDEGKSKESWQRRETLRAKNYEVLVAGAQRALKVLLDDFVSDWQLAQEQPD